MSMYLDPEEIAQLLIEECRRTSSIELDLSGIGLKDIPEVVFELTWLENLNISRILQSSKSDTEIPKAIGKLKLLKQLTCSKNNLGNLFFLSLLPQLKVLDCGVNGLTDLRLLPYMPQLTSLDCGGNYLIDLEFLKQVPKLRSLACAHNKISDLSGLSYVPQLTSLDCGINKIRDLKFLKYVPKLNTLICDVNDINNLDSLCYVPELISLDCGANKIRDLSPLSYISGLISLTCSDNQIYDLASISHVPGLSSLDFQCNQVTNLHSLSLLTELVILDCSENKIHDLSPIYNLVMSGTLNWLSLYGNPLVGIPSIVLGNDAFNDCSLDIREYWQDLEKGSDKQQQLKVQFVGNGRVGKTTLAYVLEHKRAPDTVIKSTHGITIEGIQQSLDGEDEPVTLQLWDFGGQEIYHATHRLFLSDDCLYLLLWAEETKEHPDETCHPLSYWLESIYDLGNNSPVILVKNQIDRSDHLPERPAYLTNDLPGVNQIRSAVKVSAMQNQGMYGLRGAIQDVLSELSHRVCLELPSSWLEVQRNLELSN